MSYILNARERKALEKLGFDHHKFLIKSDLTGIGEATLGRVVGLGLVKKGPGRFGEKGWRITDDGWRCMYGATCNEIMAKPNGIKVYPFIVWRWPIDPTAIHQRM